MDEFCTHSSEWIHGIHFAYHVSTYIINVDNVSKTMKPSFHIYDYEWARDDWVDDHSFEYVSVNGAWVCDLSNSLSFIVYSSFRRGSCNIFFPILLSENVNVTCLGCFIDCYHWHWAVVRFWFLHFNVCVAICFHIAFTNCRHKWSLTHSRKSILHERTTNTNGLCAFWFDEQRLHCIQRALLDIHTTLHTRNAFNKSQFNAA